MFDPAKDGRGTGWRAALVLSLIPLALLLGVLLSSCGSGTEPASSIRNTDPSDEAKARDTPSGSKQRNQAGPTQSSEKKPSVTVRPSTARNGGAKSEQSGARRAVQSMSAAKPVKPFIDSPRVSGGAGDKADSILGVRYGEHAGYQRVVVDLGVGNRAAQQVPEWSLSSLTGDGLMRLTLPSITSTRTTDGSLGDSLATNYYVVRGPEGGMFIDMFSRSAFIYRVVEVPDPARLVIDFKPSDASLQYPLPAESDNTVLVEPRAQTAAGGPFVVSGYSRNPEAMNNIVLEDSSGRVLLRDSVPSNDWSKTWGYFETTLSPPQFSGEATLRVGAQSPRDGSFTGASIPVEGN